MDRIVKVIESKKTIKALMIEGTSGLRGTSICAHRGLEVLFNKYFEGYLHMSIESVVAGNVVAYSIKPLYKESDNAITVIEPTGNKVIIKVIEKYDSVIWELKEGIY